MAKPEWGTKRTCPSCGARFYDFLREPIVCPVCGAAYDPAAQSRPRRTRAPAKLATAAVEEAGFAPEPVEEEAEVETEADDDEEAAAAESADDEESEDDSESAIEDVSELGDDDMADVIDTEIEDEETER